MPESSNNNKNLYRYMYINIFEMRSDIVYIGVGGGKGGGQYLKPFFLMLLLLYYDDNSMEQLRHIIVQSTFKSNSY